NSRAAGFYRYRLDDGLRAALIAHMAELTAEERINLVDNEWALLQAGVARAADHISMIRALAGERDRSVLSIAFEQLQWIAAHALTDRTERPFAAVAEWIFGPVLERLGMDGRPGDGEDDEELRGVAIRAMGELAGDARV